MKSDFMRKVEDNRYKWVSGFIAGLGVGFLGAVVAIGLYLIVVSDLINK